MTKWIEQTDVDGATMYQFQVTISFLMGDPPDEAQYLAHLILYATDEREVRRMMSSIGVASEAIWHPADMEANGVRDVITREIRKVERPALSVRGYPSRMPNLRRVLDTRARRRAKDGMSRGGD